jgi:hypothetical protein
VRRVARKGLLTVAPLVLALIPFGALPQPVPPACTISFDGGGGSAAWNAAANWDPDVLPGPADHACIGASFTVVHSTGADSVQTLQVDGGLTMSGGTLSPTSAADDSWIVEFTQTGGTLGGPGTIELRGSGATSSTWSGGTMAGPGTTRVAIGAAMSLDGAPKILSTGRQFEVLGTVTWSAGSLAQGGSPLASVSVAQGGVIDLVADVSLLSAGPLDVAAGGTVRKSAGVGNSSVQSRPTNEGLIEVSSGTLSFTGTIKNGGLLSAGAGAALVAPSINNAGVIGVRARFRRTWRAAQR